MLWDQWEIVDDEAVNYARNAAREFLYDSGRQRYLVRDLRVDEGYLWEPVDGWCWTDYAGEQPYADFTFDPNNPLTERMGYLSGLGVHGQQTVGESGAQTYLHGDLIDSTMLTTDGAGQAVNTLAYTAFGEPIGNPALMGTRYQYGGGYGYESDLLVLEGASGTAPITLQHVGARWYQPGIGRFVQRDPLGLVGGLNVYTYVDNEPCFQVDPDGFMSWGPWPNKGIIRYGPSRVGWSAAGKGIYALAFRVGVRIHIYGIGGALCLGGSIAAAAAVGAGTGMALDWVVEKATGQSISGRIGDGLYRLLPGFWKWTLRVW